MVAAGLTDINFALSFWTFVTFVILLVVLGKFAWGPILQMIETREKTIADAIESAKRERAAAEAAAAEMRASLELVRKNQQEVAAAKAELLARAKKESEDLLQAARKTITEEKRQALAELRGQAVDIAILAAGRLVQTSMDQQKQKQLVEEYLSQLPKETRV